jgi:hypothetical protein
MKVSCSLRFAAALVLVSAGAAAAPQALSWITTTAHPADRAPYYAPGFGLGGFFFSKDQCGDLADGHSARAGASGLQAWTAGPIFLGNETKQGDPTATTLTHAYSVSWGRCRVASVDSNGTLSPWTLAMADPAEGHILEATGTARGPIRGAMAVADVAGTKVLYSLGGWEYGTTNAVIPDVFYTAIRSDGLLENWKQTTSMPLPLMRSTVAFAAGCLYVFGGFPSNDFANHTDAVVCASVNADGSLGAWQSLPPMPKAGGAIAGLADEQYVYLVGGLTHHDPPFEGYADVVAASYAPGCQLGPWIALSALPEAAAETPYAVLAGKVYVMSTQETAPIPVYVSEFHGRVSNSLGESEPVLQDAGADQLTDGKASDAIVGGGDAAGADGADAAGSAEAGSLVGWRPAVDDSGCSCRTNPAMPGRAVAWIVLLALWTATRAARAARVARAGNAP